MMTRFKQIMINCQHRLLSEKGFAALLLLIGAVFIGLGIHRFWVRPEPFGLVSFLGCAAAAFAGFFLLLVSDYVFHHAPLVFIPWSAALIYFAIIQPHFAVGLGLALWYMLALQLRD